MIYRFGTCELDLARRELRRDGEPVALQPKPMSLLALLIAERHRVVPKDELLEEVWSGVAVTESSLTRAISVARKAIGDRGERSFIRSHARRGYRFVGAVDEVEGSASAVGAAAPTGVDAFVGREAATVALQRQWTRALGGEGQVAVVRGEPGIGKSRLTDAFVSELRAAGVSVLEARADGGPVAPPYWVWLQLLRQVAGAAEDSALDPIMASAETGRGGSTVDPDSERFELFDAVTRVLRAQAAASTLR